MLEWHSIACCLNMFTPNMQAKYMYMYIEKSMGLKQNNMLIEFLSPIYNIVGPP